MFTFEAHGQDPTICTARANAACAGYRAVALKGADPAVVASTRLNAATAAASRRGLAAGLEEMRCEEAAGTHIRLTCSNACEARVRDTGCGCHTLTLLLLLGDPAEAVCGGMPGVSEVEASGWAVRRSAPWQALLPSSLDGGSAALAGAFAPAGTGGTWLFPVTRTARGPMVLLKAGAVLGARSHSTGGGGSGGHKAAVAAARQWLGPSVPDCLTYLGCVIDSKHGDDSAEVRLIVAAIPKERAAEMATLGAAWVRPSDISPMDGALAIAARAAAGAVEGDCAPVATMDERLRVGTRGPAAWYDANVAGLATEFEDIRGHVDQAREVQRRECIAA